MYKSISINEKEQLKQRKISSIAVNWAERDTQGTKFLYPVEYDFSRVVWLGQCNNCQNYFLRDAKSIQDLKDNTCNDCKKVKNDKTIDETGKVYGRLIVLGKAPKKENTRDTFWLCQCDCENKTIITVNGCNLRNGRTKNCGCQRLSRLTHYPGQNIGNFELIANTEKKNQDGSYIWKVKCLLCGKETKLTTDQIHANLSCGCESMSKGEYKISEILTKSNINFIRQKTFDTCYFPDTNAYARFDFYLPDYNCCIEYDGKQHFKYFESGWSTKEQLDKTKEHDQFKNNWCKENNIKLLRVPYTQYENLEEIISDKIRKGFIDE